MQPQFLHLPKSVNDMQETVSEFEQKFGTIQAFGCIDGTHVQIKRPIENSKIFYLTYKSYVMQKGSLLTLIVDGQGRFMTRKFSKLYYHQKI